MLRDINRVISKLNANIHSQLLSNDPDIGYLIMDLDVFEQVCVRLIDLAMGTRTRIVY